MLKNPPKITSALAAGALLFTVVSCTPPADNASAETVESSSSSASAAGSSSERTKPAPAAGWSERLIDAPYKPEDLVETSSGAVIVSAMAENPGESGSSGSLYYMDPDTTEISPAWPSQSVASELDAELFGECSGPLGEEETSPHGITVESADDGAERLYVVNHGGRESIEVFDVLDDGGQPGLTWIGCVELPEGSFGNGVAADPNSDGFFVTHFLNPADMENEFQRAFAGEDTGHVLHWTPESGWTQLPQSTMSTPNGIAVSEDGESLYVASWGGRKLVELDPSSGAVLRETPVDIMPDNLRFTDSGAVLVTGQVIDSFDTFVGYEFGGVQPEDRYDILELDPESFTTTVFAEGSVAGFGNPTTALPVGEKVFVGAVAGTHILELSQR
ncbi:hypothetical protein [Corynebacterium guangdongense]|uniref:SMP-30/Gluconolactonase/LRE-like region domain-containing protein n=1 Tax=Corynebacterium guangdongense TaxID=1783348 RepID=A0ABU1ZU27_9CORY|nr:hypothetical protein [Corynebacterium guangdongense]MDR7328375.1 hypothetical protein [Corynebacterium guangdongense]WJZ16952.1 SMP-30/Gluconolaconase/LRE-like region [Corynebacterium guangdongense]